MLIHVSSTRCIMLIVMLLSATGCCRRVGTDVSTGPINPVPATRQDTKSISVVYAHGSIGSQSHWWLQLEPSGTMYDSGIEATDELLRRSFELGPGNAGEIGVWLLIHEEAKTSVATVAGAVARLVTTAQQTVNGS